MKSKVTVKQVWIKPTVTSQELKLRTLLGENGWLNNNNKGVLAAITSTTQ